MAEPVNETVTKNGIRLRFFESPWRAYTVDARADNTPDTFRHPWTFDEPYGRVPSVTGVNGVLDKSGPLVGWAVNVTCEGGWQMVRDGYKMPGHWRTFQTDMRDAGLDHRSVTKEAQLRGTSVHKIGEDWVNEGKFPNLADYPEAWRGYVRAIAKFLSAHGEGLSVAEQITGSVKHGFAGTCDTVAVATFGDHTVRCDYKTSKQVYARSHFRQLGAYELGAVEGGDEPTDRLGVVILGADGEFSIHYADEVEWRTTPADSFLRVLDVWRDEQPLKKHEEATYKARKAREKAANNG